MNKLKKYYLQFMMLVIRAGFKKAKFLKKKKIFHYMGENVFYISNLLPTEPFLVSIHDNVIISAGVRIITHSGDHVMFNQAEKTSKYYSKYGKVEICENVYIGADAIICYGVTIGKNCVIGAGAVVTKDVPEGSVVAGVPAKYIESTEELRQKTIEWSKKFKNPKSRKIIDLLEENPVEFIK